MSDIAKIVECPRDAWQGLAKAMPTEVKADYLRALVAAGFKHIDAVSFVSPAAVPQMADAELVLEYLDPPDDVEIIGIVVNRKGAERAAETGRVQTVGFPYSVSETFLKRNQAQTADEAVGALEEVGSVAQLAGMDLIGYISMAFGNPYGDAWSVEEVIAACDLLVESGVKTISLADTVGLATAEEVGLLVGAVIAAHGSAVEIGVHLHARPEGAAAKIHAAYEAGCRRFDSAIGGMGGCPFAQDALVGNIATETLLLELGRLGAELPEIRQMDVLLRASAELARKYGAQVQ
ncbi:MAG: hydroxymethylglutaryl-CoA lyase [Acidobacteriaceae bacterium]